jgi:hypothetical protein
MFNQPNPPAFVVGQEGKLVRIQEQLTTVQKTEIRRRALAPFAPHGIMHVCSRCERGLVTYQGETCALCAEKASREMAAERRRGEAQIVRCAVYLMLGVALLIYAVATYFPAK